MAKEIDADRTDNGIPAKFGGHQVPDFLQLLAPRQHPGSQQDQPVRPFASGLFRSFRPAARGQDAPVPRIPEEPLHGLHVAFAHALDAVRDQPVPGVRRQPGMPSLQTRNFCLQKNPRPIAGRGKKCVSEGRLVGLVDARRGAVRKARRESANVSAWVPAARWVEDSASIETPGSEPDSAAISTAVIQSSRRNPRPSGRGGMRAPVFRASLSSPLSVTSRGRIRSRRRAGRRGSAGARSPVPSPAPSGR